MLLIRFSLLEQARGRHTHTHIHSHADIERRSRSSFPPHAIGKTRKAGIVLLLAAAGLRIRSALWLHTHTHVHERERERESQRTSEDRNATEGESFERRRRRLLSSTRRPSAVEGSYIAIGQTLPRQYRKGRALYSCKALLLRVRVYLYIASRTGTYPRTLGFLSLSLSSDAKAKGSEQ